MATLYIERTTPFKRGSQSIQIMVDGKPACNMWNGEPRKVEVEEGEHTLQASMAGVQGAPISIVAEQGTTRMVKLTPGEIKQEHPAVFIATLLLFMMPDRIAFGSFFWIKLAAMICLVVYIAYEARKYRNGKLVLEDAGVIAADNKVALQ